MIVANDPAKDILEYLLANEGWFSKDDILSQIDISTNLWLSTINQLCSDGFVERQGDTRGAQYKFKTRS